MLSDILSITNGASKSLVIQDQVLDTNQLTSDDSKTNSSITTLSNEILSSNGDSHLFPSNHSDKAACQKFPDDNLKDEVRIVGEMNNGELNKDHSAKVKVSRLLHQGEFTSFSLPPDNDVIAERYDTGCQQISREKLYAKKNMQQCHKRVVQATVIERPVEKEKKQPTAICCNNQENSEQLISSTIGPFLKIQDALENKIASLVSTLQYADSAEKDFLKAGYEARQTKDTAMLDALNRVEENLKDLQKNKPCCQPEEETTSYNPEKNARPKSSPTLRSGIVNTPPRIKKRPQHKPSVEQQLFQTPIPRRRPPEPVSENPSNSDAVSRKASAPRISRKGYALLHEILQENQTPPMEKSAPPPSVMKSKVPPQSRVHPLKSQVEVAHERGNKSKSHGSSTCQKKKNLHDEVNRIMVETTGLKKKIQNVNKDMETIMKTSDDESFESKEVVKSRYEASPLNFAGSGLPLLAEHSLSEECPLDKYLVFPHQTEFLKPDINKENVFPKSVDTIGRRVAEVLRETQEQRRQLDDNLNDILRKHNELNAFLDLPYNEREENVQRIRKDVTAQINAIRNEIETELQKEVKTNPSSGKIPGTEKSKVQSGNRISLVERNRIRKLRNEDVSAKNKASSGIQTKARANTRKTIKRPEKKKIVMEPPPESSTAYDELISRHLYGRQPHIPTRKTTKQKQLRADDTVSRQTWNKSLLNDGKKTPKKDEPQGRRHHQHSSEKFYFHPSQQVSQHHLPVTGDLFPVAVPLAEPSRDPAKRLPIFYTSEETNDEAKLKHGGKAVERQRPSRVRQLATSNVAVIEVKHNESDSSQTSSVKDQIRAKLRKRVKEKIKLNFQPLPNVDIDTTEASTLSSASTIQPSHDDIRKQKSLQNIEDQIGGEENPYDFQDFVAVRDIEKEQSLVEEKDGSSDEDVDFMIPATTLHGDHPTRHQDNHHSSVNDGPPFPPIRPCHEANDDFEMHQKSNLEEMAQEWLEQELLAKIVNQLEVQNPDPTLKEMADRADLSLVEIETTSTNWIDRIIGIHGIQLFMDAGIPVDKDFITDLIRHVIIENLDSIYGYPQPRGTTHDITIKEDENIDNAFRTIHTPLRTPLSASPVSIHTPHIIDTPEQSSLGSLAEQVLDETDVQPELIEDEPISYPIITTPLPSEKEDTRNSDIEYPGNNIATPLPSMSEEHARTTDIRKEVMTPEVSEMNDVPSFIDQMDFVPTSPERTLTPEQPKTPKQDSPSLTYIPLLPVHPPSPSTPSTTLNTFSTSTAVGLSTVDAISEGEHLFPSQAISEGSEGEPADVVFPFVMGQKTLKETIEDPFSDNRDESDLQIKDLVKELIQQRPVNGLKSEGEVSTGGSPYSLGQVRDVDQQPQARYDEFREDTLNSLDLHQYHPDTATNNKEQESETSTRPPIQVRPTLVAEKPYDSSFLQERGRNSSTGISEGEAIIDDKSDKINVSLNTDLLSVGQYNPNRIPISDFTDNMSQDIDAENDDLLSVNSLPPDRPRIIMVQQRNKAEESHTDYEKSEGEFLYTQNQEDANEENASKPQQMVLTLPSADAEIDELSTLNDDDPEEDEENLSEYDISTLSGGEL